MERRSTLPSRTSPDHRRGSSAARHPLCHVAIVGAGFSGTMVAVHLLAAGFEVTLIDRSGRFAEGLAYGTTEPVHRLNVRASAMSAFSDDADHFVNWLGRRGVDDGESYAPRLEYRAYIQDILGAARGQIRRLTDVAVAMTEDGLLLGSGERLAADAVIVAAGNLPPEPLRLLAAASIPTVDDPWNVQGRAVLAELAAESGDILVIGTGLTMVDTVLSLDARGFAGRVVALSRRGLVPRPHAPVVPVAIGAPDRHSLRHLLRWARSAGRNADWRAVVDSVRPFTAAIWREWTDAERARFLRHLRPWWEVHRHRIAPEVVRRLDVLKADGRLVVRAGRIVDVEADRVGVRFRGAFATERLNVAGIVNCTGPQGDLRKSRDPFLCDLLSTCGASTDEHGLGLNVDAELRVLSDANVPPLYAIGPMTRGTFWETVAVPDIRGQAQTLAATIAGDFAFARPLSRSVI